MGSLRRYGLEVKLGNAWIASTYRNLGFGVQQSADDTDQARQYFIDRFGVGFEVSGITLARFVLVSITAGSLAAIAPAQRASKLNVLSALQYE